MLATDGLLPLSLPVVAPNLPGAAPAPAAYPANFPATRGDFLAMNGPAVTALLVSTCTHEGARFRYRRIPLSAIYIYMGSMSE